MSTYHLPEWQELSKAESDGIELTQLERFIYENEPAGVEETELFRRQLAAALSQVTGAHFVP